MSDVSREARRAKSFRRLRSLLRKSEGLPRYLPGAWASQYNRILDDFGALGFETAKLRILPQDLQAFSSYSAGGNEHPVTSGYHLNRDLLKQRIDSALTQFVGMRGTDK